MRDWGNLSVPLKPSPWGEGGWPSGQTDEGAMIERFRFLQGDFAACGRRVTFWTGQKVTKEPLGGRGRRALRAHRTAFPRSPITGVAPWSRQNPSSAQNLIDVLNSRRATGPWVCGKLRLMRFHNRAWICRANMPGSTHGIPHPPPSGAPSPKGEGRGMPFQSLPL